MSEKLLHTNYWEWHPRRDRGVRHYARWFSLDVLSLTSTVSLHQLNTPHVQFLYFHHVFSDEVGFFRLILSELSKIYEFVSYSEAVRKVGSGNIDRPYMCFSSDDGFRNNLSACEVLQEFGISACFFLNPKTIGLKDYDSIQAFCRDRLNAHPTAFLDWNDVEIIQAGGHEIGSHSLRHLNLGGMKKPEVASDMQEAKVLLEQNCGPIEHFAFPYGGTGNFSRVALEECFRIGHVSCASAIRGCHSEVGGTDLSKNLILRDQLVAAWPLSHLLFFLKRNVSHIPHPPVILC